MKVIYGSIMPSTKGERKLFKLLKMSLEKFRYGKFSLTAEDEKRIRKQAEARGQDPEEAVRKEKERMEQATRRLHLEKGEEERKKMEEDINKESEG